MPRTQALIVAAVIALASTASSCSKGASNAACPSGAILVEGDRLPDCTLKLIDASGSLALSSLTGKATVLNFWASWCLACLDEMPALDRFAKAHPELRVLGVNVLVQGETYDAGRRYFEERGVDYDSLVDPDGALLDRFTKRVILPVTVIVDAGGVIASRKFGEMSEQQLEDDVSKALG